MNQFEKVKEEPIEMFLAEKEKLEQKIDDCYEIAKKLNNRNLVITQFGLR